MKFVRRTNDEPSINLTPLIDIVFLLLIFFMVSTRFVDERQLPIELPAASAAPVAESAPTISLGIAADGSYRIDGRPVPANALLASLRALKAQYPDRHLRVRADGDARHADVVRVLDAAAALGFVQVDIATRAPGAAG